VESSQLLLPAPEELPADNEIKVPVFETVLGGLTIRGSIVGTHGDLEEVFELHRRGHTRVLRTECGLDDVNEAIEQVLDGSAPAPRMVFDMQATHTEGSHDGRATAGVFRLTQPKYPLLSHDPAPVNSCEMRQRPCLPARPGDNLHRV
jgi:hypothetical protein